MISFDHSPNLNYRNLPQSFDMENIQKYLLSARDALSDDSDGDVFKDAISQTAWLYVYTKAYCPSGSAEVCFYVKLKGDRYFLIKCNSSIDKVFAIETTDQKSADTKRTSQLFQNVRPASKPSIGANHRVAAPTSSTSTTQISSAQLAPSYTLSVAPQSPYGVAVPLGNRSRINSQSEPKGLYNNRSRANS
jgi:hypothetical protein